MTAIGPAKLRVLENLERREQEAQNTLDLVRSCLQANNFKDARQAFFELDSKYRGQAIELFREAMPKPQDKCSKCDVDLDFSFEDWSLKWVQGNCLNCRYQEVKKTIKENCKDIMRQRGVASRFLNASLDDFSESYQKRIKSDSGFYLSGPRGTGKTHLMCAKMRYEIINTEPMPNYKGVSDIITNYNEPLLRFYPLFISMPELLLKLRGSCLQAIRLEGYSTGVKNRYDSCLICKR